MLPPRRPGGGRGMGKSHSAARLRAPPMGAAGSAEERLRMAAAGAAARRSLFASPSGDVRARQALQLRKDIRRASMRRVSSERLPERPRMAPLPGAKGARGGGGLSLAALSSAAAWKVGSAWAVDASGSPGKEEEAGGSGAVGEEEDGVAPAVLAADINSFLRSSPAALTSGTSELLRLLEAFVEQNEDSESSRNLQREEGDDMVWLLHVMADSRIGKQRALLLAILSTVRILLRKSSNRCQMSGGGVAAVARLLASPGSLRIARELCAVVLNMCYERENVEQLLELGGMPLLVKLLAADDEQLAAAAAGALQSICYQASGRRSAVDEGALAPLVLLLRESDDVELLIRASGALHNISSDPLSIAAIRTAGAIAPLVKLLLQPDCQICGAAAGAIQNLSREAEAREEIVAAGAFSPLVDLLLGNDMEAQVSAAGALLNLVGPDLPSEHPDAPQRQALKKLLADGIALGAVFSAMTEPLGTALYDAAAAEEEAAAEEGAAAAGEGSDE
eukprot:PLAT8623.2.p1 GENE.PLAT8623.2~~PLAT8623.2.p1  ORF type:complete len:507 (-),score=225.54 PLAT8623.2:120-1640(-)